jgi:hypothetical protein
MIQPTNTAQTQVTPGPLTAEFVKLLHNNDALATPALKLLDLYVSLWEYYVIKSAEKVRLEDEQRQLQELNEWLANDNDILLQLYDKQAMVLWDRKRAVQALCNGMVSALMRLSVVERSWAMITPENLWYLFIFCAKYYPSLERPIKPPVKFC